jgi:hypothetical protein
MMMDFNAYYTQQAGTGIAFYPGIRYQRGHGFFGRFFKGSLLPLLQSLGHKLLSTGVDVADDVVNRGIDPTTSFKARGHTAMKSAANDMISQARTKLGTMKQNGSGKSIKGRRKAKSTSYKSATLKSTRKSKTPAKPKKKNKSTKTTKNTKTKKITDQKFLLY